MFQSINLSESYLYNHDLREQARKNRESLAKNIEKIKAIALKQIEYPQFKESYDYVDALFPNSKVTDVIIYKVGSRDFERIGFGNAGGIHDRVSKTIALCTGKQRNITFNRDLCVVAKVEMDEIIVHELCHYCYEVEGYSSLSRELREEFAYGWSIGYLRQKGYTDEEIVTFNFLPYLVDISLKEANRNIRARNGISDYEYNRYPRYKFKEFVKLYEKKIIKRAKEIAMEKGLRLVNLYSKKLKEEVEEYEEYEDANRFDILDL